MSFDKVKAMRDAERFLTQGKIGAAINEYKRVVEVDKTDVNTLNMLGDLHTKASQTEEAVKCFNLAADQYSRLGFVQKAIAIYNKISRLKPDSIEVSAKLAQLYQAKGSFAEARDHFTIVAEQYAKNGKKAEALGVWKEIASLDQSNSEIYLKIADAYWQDDQKDEAANAYIEAGNRLCRKNQHESAITAFSRALEIRPDDLAALRAFSKTQIQLGFADEAARTLESSLARQPHNKEIINLLADCYIESGRLADAEKTIVKLVEQEPTQFPKLHDIFDAYIKARDVAAAGRMLTISSEHMLVGGRAVELEQKINEILDLNSEDLDGLRLLVRLHSWQRDEAGLKIAFERLAEAAKQQGEVEDEKRALSQLVIMAPQNVYFAERLHELSLKLGSDYYAQSKFAENLNPEVPTFDSYRGLTGDEEAVSSEETSFAFVANAPAETTDSNSYEVSNEPTLEAEQESAATDDALTESVQFETNAGSQFEGVDFDKFKPVVDEVDADATAESTETIETETIETETIETETIESETHTPKYRSLSPFEQHGLSNEIEGIDFYMEQGFWDLAERTLDEIAERYGNQPETEGLRKVINEKLGHGTDSKVVSEDTSADENDATRYETTELKPLSDELAESFQTNADTRFETEAATFEEFSSVPNDETTVAQTETSDSTVTGNSWSFTPNAKTDETEQIAESETVEDSEATEFADVAESIRSRETAVADFNPTTLETDQQSEFAVESTPQAQVYRASEDDTIHEVEAETTNFAEEDLEPTQTFADEPTETLVSETVAKEPSQAVVAETPQTEQNSGFEDLKAELSAPTPTVQPTRDEPYDDDFETNFQTGTVYREMGLFEDSIREFQSAIKRVSPNDGTRRYFLCCNMLGICFLEKEMPTIAIKWLKQGLECGNLSEDELNGMRYELAGAYEKAGNRDAAQALYEEIYCVDVSFRDVGERLHELIAV